MTIAIDCQNITKSFGNNKITQQVLRGAKLEVQAGEFTLLVGPSGCGKTTLISIIAGILAPDQGSCKLLGIELDQLNEAQKLSFRAKNIGFIFQSFNLIPTLNVSLNVSIPLLINSANRQDTNIRTKEMLELVGLTAKANSLPASLSGGEQQRVAIARALVHQPKILICDEPTSSLDHHTGLKIMDLMCDLNKKFGMTVLIVTHDNRIFHYADKIAYMDDGLINKITTSVEYIK